MKSITQLFISSSLLLLVILLSSCIQNSQHKDSSLSAAPAVANDQAKSQNIAPAPAKYPTSLPVQYQTASYVVNKDESEDIAKSEESVLKVGARITSTRGPQPLWDILKRLAALKRMNVSWAEDVDQNAQVDVDINPKDDFYNAINYLLAQKGYFAEFKNTTIFVRNKITKQYRIAMPFITQKYSTETGGDIIGAGGAEKGFKALIKLQAQGSPVGTSVFSKDNDTKTEFDIWNNIESNLKVILNILETSEVAISDYEKQFGAENQGRAKVRGKDTNSSSEAKGSYQDKYASKGANTAKKQKVKTSRQTSKDGSYFLIDKPVGIITVTTTKAMHERITKYINSLKKSLYKQITIEAKIIEVKLTKESNIGINWSKVLKNFGLSGSVTFGDNGQVYPFVFNNDAVQGPVTYTNANKTAYFKTINPGQFISNISFASRTFDVFLNALNEQGDAKVLSNPKISVMNGQPAFITVGRNVTYIDSIDSDLDSDTGIVTYTVNTDRILSGIGMALTATVLDNTHVVMNLVPVVSNLQEPIEYRDVGNLGGTVGLPIVNIREMSTTVKVADGEMLVIGGLISDTKENSGEFAPLLGDVPIVKYLFGSETKTHVKRELIILLKPRIF